MKKKKFLVVISMLAVVFALAGCANTSTESFEYSESELLSTTKNLFATYAGVSEDYADYYINGDDEFEASAVKGIRQAIDNDNVGEFGTFSSDYSVEEAADSVTITVINEAANRDVEVSVKYTENKDYYKQYDLYYNQILDYQDTLAANGTTLQAELEKMGFGSLDEYVTSQLASSGVAKFTPVEMVVAPVYSKGELVKQAAVNTLIGMGTVFIVLIFISFIISLFKFIPALTAKKAKMPEAKQEAPKAAVSVPKAAAANPMDDSQLVAVITAAVYAMASESGNGAVSKDTLVVRSIKRAKK